MAHPNPSQSQVNLSMAAMAGQLDGITLIDLYALYPRFKIDVDAEQRRLLAHDVIVLQFPFYWYSMPALLKEWLDLVLEYGFAYGSEGDRLVGKSLLVATSAGGAQAAYSQQGRNQFPIRTLLTPLEQTAELCRMRYLPPLVLFAALAASSDDRLVAHVNRYRRVLEALRDDRLDLPAAFAQELLGDPVLPVRDENAQPGYPARGNTDPGKADTENG
jgi:putative NADPH-quinone reductase